MRDSRQPNSTKKTSKGTELPLLNLKGKPYLRVAHRLVWFREDHPDGFIQTEFLKIDEGYCIAHAKIMIAVNGALHPVASGTKKETANNFPDFIEKAETGAIGRALAIAGYGTQFEPELDEESRIVDSPVEIVKVKVGLRDKSQENVDDGDGEASQEQLKARAGDSRPAAVHAPRSVEAADRDASTTSKADKTPKPVAPVSEREKTNVLIARTAKIVSDKRLKPMAELKSMMQDKYGSDDKAKLTDEQAKEFLGTLNAILSEEK